MSDDSIAANIAFGEKLEDINQETVEKVSKIANLHNFIIEDLPNKYQTIIGENGVRLSGGQRQRIGIAGPYITIHMQLFLMRQQVL